MGRPFASGCASAWLHPLGNGTEMGREPPLIVLRDALIAEHQDRVPMPCILDLADGFGVERLAEIDAGNLCADDRM